MSIFVCDSWSVDVSGKGLVKLVCGRALSIKYTRHLVPQTMMGFSSFFSKFYQRFRFLIRSLRVIVSHAAPSLPSLASAVDTAYVSFASAYRTHA